MTSGIYRIYQVSRDRTIYVGSSGNIVQRWRQHHHNLRKGNTHNQYLQRVWNKYGEADFKFKILEECSPGQLIEREQFWANALKPTCNVGEFVESSMRGHIFTKEHRAKMSAARIGRKFGPRSEETRRKISEAQLGKVIPPDQIAKMAATKRGRKLTEEHRQKLKGHPHAQSQETRKKISQAMQGNKRGLGNKSNTGRKLPEEQKLKMSVAQRARQARKE